MSKTLKELAQEALNVQDACNLCGVAQSFARAMRDLGDHTNGTDARNQHPITRVWLDKMNQLAGIQHPGCYVCPPSGGLDPVTEAYSVVHDLAQAQ